MALVTIQFLFQTGRLTFGEMEPKKYKIDHRFDAFKKIRKFFKLIIFDSIKV